MFTLFGKHSKEQLVPRELGVCNSARLVSGMRSFRRGRGPTVNRTDISATDNVSLLLGIKKTSTLRLLILIAHYFRLFEIRAVYIHNFLVISSASVIW